MGRGAFSLLSLGLAALGMGGCSFTAKRPSPGSIGGSPIEITEADKVEVEDMLSSYKDDEGAWDDVYVPKKKGLALVPTSHAIPLEIHKPQVRKWIQYFTVQDHDRFARFLYRGAHYKDLVSRILKAEGVPAEIFYLGIIESGYVTHARSRASAVGIWQFIQGTGRSYGLRVNPYVDERRDPVRATRAAARYLKDLHERFDSWPLALAAYNSGEGRVAGAIKRGRTKDYWRLSNLGFLPNETADYVPKFMAAVWIGQHPAQYGFKKSLDESYPDLLGVELPGHITLRSVARVSGIKYEELKSVNPHLLRGVVPPTKRGKYVLWVEEEKAAAVKQVSRRLASLKRSKPIVYRRRPTRKVASRSIRIRKAHPKVNRRVVKRPARRSYRAVKVARHRK